MKTSTLRTLGLVSLGIIVGSFFMMTMNWVPQTNASVFSADGKVQLGKKGYEPRQYEALPDPSPRFQAVSKDILPTVVYINVEGVVTQDQNSSDYDDLLRQFFNRIPQQQQRQQKVRGSGSGVIVSDDGYIVTNNHVVESADKNGIKVTLNDKREFTAKLIGRDPTTDLAVIKIDGNNLPVAPLGDSQQVEVGQWVLAIGNPMSLTSTVTAGIISATGRNINIIRDQYGIESFIQTDAAINPGNSGGALVDMTGAVIGINSAIATSNGGYQGYGFAIPVNLVKKVAADLIANGKVMRGVLGIRMQDIDGTMSKALKLKPGTGVLVNDLVKNSPAIKAGVKPEDVILKADGIDVSAANQLAAIVGSKRPGDKVKLLITRGGSEKEITVTLANISDLDPEFAANDNDNSYDTNSSNLSFKKLGIDIRTLTKAEKKAYDVESGVLIESSDNDNDVLVKGLVILEVDRVPVKTPTDVESILKDKKSGDAVLLKVKNQNKQTAYSAVTIK